MMPKRNMATKLGLTALLLAFSPTLGIADYPLLWDPQERISKPPLSDQTRLRFLTTVDFPPFNHLDQTGRLSGFHVDLATAICRELDLLERCQIQALEWDKLLPSIEQGQGEAIIAGLVPGTETAGKLIFTRSYFPFPARLATRRANPVDEKTISGKRVGVLERSGHDAMLGAFLSSAKPVRYSREDWMLADLKEGKLDAVLSDGMRLSFWLAGASSDGCCDFIGGAYYSPELLGNGLQIATSAKSPEIAGAIDYALKELSLKGTLNELYLRYFPKDFF